MLSALIFVQLTACGSFSLLPFLTTLPSGLVSSSLRLHDLKSIAFQTKGFMRGRKLLLDTPHVPLCYRRQLFGLFFCVSCHMRVRSHSTASYHPTHSCCLRYLPPQHHAIKAGWSSCLRSNSYLINCHFVVFLKVVTVDAEIESLT